QQNPKRQSWITSAAKAILKPVLYDLAHGKCVFCESALEVTGHLEIEHYVAKSVDPHRCFEWTNLLPACSKCNRSKGDQDHGGSLFKPDEEDPEPYFWIHPDTGELQPSPKLDFVGQRRVLETIRLCDLQRPALCFKRIRMMNRVSRWVASLVAISIEEATEDW